MRDCVPDRITRRFPAKPPYDFELSMSLFSNGNEQIRSFHDGTLRQVLEADETPILLNATSAGDAEHPSIATELVTEEPLPKPQVRMAERIVKHLFSLDFDLEPFYRVASDDPVLSPIISKLKGVKTPRTPTSYEALVDSITEQQISLRAAHTMQERIIRQFGDRLVVEGVQYFAFPRPARLAHASIEDLRRCGLSGRKSEYIRGISAGIVHGDIDLEKIEGIGESDLLVKELSAIRGIGRWTAEMTALRGMGRHDLLPADDVGLRRTLAHYYEPGKRISAEEARKIAEPWGEWRGLAAFYLIVAEYRGL
jgi:DNA-3-methyladenine glycosylase II